MSIMLPEPARTWLRPLGDAGDTALVCFPHAGGSAGVFGSWKSHMPEHLALLGVQYPGRADRGDEPMSGQLQSLAQQIAMALQWARFPYVLLGHSMGALLAYETCLSLADLGLGHPEQLIVSASPPPDQAPARSRSDVSSRVLTLPGPDEGDRDARLHFAQLVEADLRLLRDYEPTGRRVQVPLTCLYNTDDPDMSAQDAEQWRAFTTADFRTQELPGGHFSSVEDPQAVGEMLRRRLSPQG
ncbi:alpha/beta fold hydrolase [Streptomyces sp. NPDC001904]|uniref:thioesterase II family protein n=1 Tax=Streptomyces sp. NPDC001904 TaxID=3154531 RepID=UPI003332DBA6